MNSLLAHLLWVYVFQVQPVCSTFCNRLVAFAGVSHPTEIAILALLVLVASVFLAVLCLVLMIGGLGSEARGIPTCAHDIRQGKFCPVCARDADILAEMQRKMHTATARR